VVGLFLQETSEWAGPKPNRRWEGEEDKSKLRGIVLVQSAKRRKNQFSVGGDLLGAQSPKLLRRKKKIKG